MSGGYKWNSEHHNNSIQEFRENENLLEYMFKCQLSHMPGTRYNQNSGGIYLLTKIIEKAASKKIDKFAHEKLFKPLGIVNYRWEKDKTGKNKGPYSLYMRSKDMILFGQLILNKGKWNGTQIISKEWIEVSTNLHIELTPLSPIFYEMGEKGYGYLWWIFKDVIAARGHSGQHIIISEEKSAVIVITAGSSMYTPARIYLDYIKKSM
jgi:CubicO group peptidase (beta-lactamase class C family)